MQRESAGLDLASKNALLELQNAHLKEKVEEAAVRVRLLVPVYETATALVAIAMLDVVHASCLYTEALTCCSQRASQRTTSLRYAV